MYKIFIEPIEIVYNTIFTLIFVNFIKTHLRICCKYYENIDMLNLFLINIIIYFI